MLINTSPDVPQQTVSSRSTVSNNSVVVPLRCHYFRTNLGLQQVVHSVQKMPPEPTILQAFTMGTMGVALGSYSGSI